MPAAARKSRKPLTAKQRKDGTFKKGIKPGPGRAIGQRNRTTTMLKDAILQAATLIGVDGKGKDGLVGFLMRLGLRHPQVYARLLEKVLPLQIAVQEKSKRRMTAAEAAQKLRERGLPIPAGLLALVGPQEGATAIAHTLEDEEFDVDADADAATDDDSSERD